jgi:peptidoglycan/LPS O-acetylase OafA/YrhL
MNHQKPAVKHQRVAGLDSIRAICALWVMMAHIGFPPLIEGLDRSNPFGKLVGGIYGNLWSGPAAVIVFFVVSGFCIHYPFVSSLQIPSLRTYLARRYLRIGIPLIVAIGISSVLKNSLSLFNDSILWTLVAEMIYYGLYPGLLACRRKCNGWAPIILGCVGMALVLASTNPSAGNYPSYGNLGNWIIGLPCWLSGCWLAEKVQRKEPTLTPSPNSIWTWRLSIWGMATVCSILRYHSPFGYPWTLNLFSIAVVFWLAHEIAHCTSTPFPRWLEWGGSWSYSLYLIHLLAAPLYGQLNIPNLGYFFNWTLLVFFVLLCSYLFYLLVELPSHFAARSVGKLLSEARGQRLDQEPARRSNN